MRVKSRKRYKPRAVVKETGSKQERLLSRQERGGHAHRRGHESKLL